MEKKDIPVIDAREKGKNNKDQLLIIFILQLAIYRLFILCLFVFFPSGPGSGRYSLPTCVGHRGHDPTKKCMPQYSFGKRLANPSEFQISSLISALANHMHVVHNRHNCVFFRAVFRKDCSPGPGYHIDSATTRFGTDGTPSYSILGRQRDQSESCSHPTS